MNGKGSKPRAQIPGPDGKTPNGRYADNWGAVFGDGETTGLDRSDDEPLDEPDEKQ